MVMSVFHRLTGLLLYGGVFLLALILFFSAFYPYLSMRYEYLFYTFSGKLFSFIFIFSFFHHVFGGLRHWIWDLGFCFSKKARFGLAWATPVLSLGASFLFVFGMSWR